MAEIGKFSGKTLAELRMMTQGQIRQAQKPRLDGKTKKELIEIEFDQTEFPDPTTGEGSSNGQIWRFSVIRDAEGNKLKSTRFDWTYYPSGEVDIITTIELDKDDQIISTKKLKHYKDGRQPEVIK